MGGDYVGRGRNRTECCPSGEDDWNPVKTLYKLATSIPQDLGDFDMVASSPFKTRFVIFKKFPKGCQKITCFKKQAQSAASKKHAEREREPWLLATLLEITSPLANKVVKIYRQRMQIEEGFRDTKCVKFGLALSHNRSLDLLRLTTLIFLATMASVVLLLAGIMAEFRGAIRQTLSGGVECCHFII